MPITFVQYFKNIKEGILRNPDRTRTRIRTRTRTRIRTKPGLDTRTYLNSDLSPQNPDSIDKKTEFKTGLIKKRGFKSVARQSVILRLYT